MPFAHHDPGDAQPVQELDGLASPGGRVLDLLAQPVPRRQRVPGAGGPLDLGAGGVRRGGLVRRGGDPRPYFCSAARQVARNCG